MPGWPELPPPSLPQPAWVLVSTQPGIIGTFFQKAGPGSGGLHHRQNTLPPGSRLTPHLSHGLLVSLLLLTLLYGADIMVPTRGMVTKMDVYRRQVQLWVSNCFRSTPIPILSAEACIPPLQAIISHKRYMTALRLVCAGPTINPAAGVSARPYPPYRSTGPRPHTRHYALAFPLM